MSVNIIKVNNSDTNYTHSIFDISSYTGNQYEDLSSALAAVPEEKQSGGMTVSFVSTSDNKYTQVRCMAQNFTTDTTQWQGVDDVPTAGSDNLVKSSGVHKYSMENLVYDNSLEIGNDLFELNRLEYRYNTAYGLEKTKKDKYIVVINGTSEPGANSVCGTKVGYQTLTAGQKYTLYIESKKDNVSFGIAASTGWVRDANDNKFETSKANKVKVFTPANDYSGIYLYIYSTETSLETFNYEDYRFFLLEGEYTDDDFKRFYYKREIDQLFATKSELKVELKDLEAYTEIYETCFNNNIVSPPQNGSTVAGITFTVKEKDITVFNGSYTSGANRVSKQEGTIEVGHTYTFYIQSKRDGILFGISAGGGFVTDTNGNRAQTTKANKAYTFTVASVGSGSDAVYVYIGGGVPVSFTNDEYRFFLLEGEYSDEDIVKFITPYNLDSFKYKESRFYGKKVSFYGDSITEGFRWCNELVSAFKFNATNNGIGSTTVTNENTKSLCTTTRMLGTYQEGGVAIPSDVDVIFVEGATNDWLHSREIGSKTFTPTPDDTKFGGACHMMFKNLTTLFPNAEIIIIGTLFGKWADNPNFNDSYGVLNNQNMQTIEYGDIMLDIAGKWGIKGINVGRLAQINDNNISSYNPDGLHPNAAGGTRIADVVKAYLLSL